MPISLRSDRPPRTRQLTEAALVTALLAASAWIAIPTGAVPITLQVFFVVLAALLLDPLAALAAIGTYLALGAAGFPVFSAGHGGLGVLLGPTGGYLFGFAAGACGGSVVRVLVARRLPAPIADACAAVAVIAIIYVVGTAQLALVANLSPVVAIAGGVAPFIVPDVVKATVAVAVASAVRRGVGERS